MIKKYQYPLKTGHLACIAQVKEYIDYALFSSVIVFIVLAALSQISLWVAGLGISLVIVYQMRWSNEALISRFESLDSSYEFNESYFIKYARHHDAVSEKIAYDAACSLLNDFQKQDITERSGEIFYEELLTAVDSHPHSSGITA